MKKVSEWNTLRAFKSRNYSLYFTGRSVSQFGTWMQRTAVVWVVYSATHSAFLLGVTIFAEQFPSFLFSVAGGVAADRYDKYKIIKLTQVTSMVQAVLLAILILTGHIIIWAILLLSIILGIINAFDVPARQALVHDVVADKADLQNGLALTTAMASLAQLLGPALSGIVLNSYGAPVCFLINAASFGGVWLSIFLMKVPEHQPKKTEKKVIAEFSEGFAYLKRTPDIAQLIIMLAVISFFVLPYNTLIPVFAKQIFKGDAATFGYISSFVGIGAVAGTVFMATRKPGAPLKKILLFGTFILGTGLICFSQITSFPVAMVFASLMGFGAISQFTVCNIYIQTHTKSDMRGRIISIMIMALFGMTPLGSVVVGAVSEHVGAPVTVLAEGIIALIAALVFMPFLRKPETPAVLTADDVTAVEETEEMMEER